MSPTKSEASIKKPSRIKAEKSLKKAEPLLKLETSFQLKSKPSDLTKNQTISATATRRNKAAKERKKSTNQLSGEACTSLFPDRYVYGAHTRWWPWDSSEFRQATDEEMQQVAHLDKAEQQRFRYLLERSKNLQEVHSAELHANEDAIVFTVGLEGDAEKTTKVLEQNLDPILREAFYLDNWPFMQKLKDDQRVRLRAQGKVDPALPAGFAELAKKLKELSDEHLLDDGIDDDDNME